MDRTLPHRSGDFHDLRLPGWLGMSAAAHLLALSVGGGIVISNAPYRHAPMTVDIVHSVPEAPIAVPALKQEMQDNSDTPPAVTSLGMPPERESGPTGARRAAPAVAPLRAEQPAEIRSNLQPGTAEPSPIDAYFSANELQVRAQPINEVLLHYPSSAYIRRIPGVVQFRLFISAQGELDKIEFVDANPRGVFEEAAWDAVRKLRFSPALRNGRPVASRKTIDVVFDPNEGNARPPARRPDSSVAER